MSPAAMCSLAVRTAASNSSRDVRASTIGGSPPPVVACDRPPARARARGTRCARRRTGRATRGLSSGVMRALAISRMRCLHVIEGEHRVEQHERRFAGRIAEASALALPDAVERRLEPRRGVVAEEADGAAGQARQVGHDRRAVLGHHAGAARRRTARRATVGLAGAARCTAWPSRARSTRNGILAEEASSARCARRLRRSRAGRRSRRARRS